MIGVYFETPTNSTLFKVEWCGVRELYILLGFKLPTMMMISSRKGRRMLFEDGAASMIEISW